MANDQSAGEKTERPSAKKLKDARDKGQVARSRDVAVALSSLAVTVAVTSLGSAMLARLATRLASALSHLGDRPLAPVTPGALTGQVVSDSLLIAIAVGPLMLVGGLSGLAGNVMQSGWVFAPEALKMNWAKLSPSNGLKRLAPKQSGVDLLKTVIAVTALSAISYNVLGEFVAFSPALARMAPADAGAEGWSRLVRLLWQAGFALLAIAAGDYGVQRWRHWSSLKMTKRDVSDESKSNDGNPQVKQRVRQIQRGMTRRRMLKAVRHASVVVTNPTHFAVALEYRRERMSAPVVVAKGKDLMAARIKKVARDHGVPTVENVPLAQALFKGAEVGDAIPAALFGAVAEVLAYLVRIKQLML